MRMIIGFHTILKPLYACCRLFFVSLLIACTPAPHNTTGAPTMAAETAQAVYLARPLGVLPESELQAHPEVLVVASFEDFEDAAQAKMGLWIDKNAIDLLPGDCQWIQQPPQRYYPIIMVGYQEPLYSFREVWDCFRIEGPYTDWETVTLEPGFSVLMYLEFSENSFRKVFQGYEEAPTIERLLEVTNELLPQSLAK